MSSAIVDNAKSALGLGTKGKSYTIAGDKIGDVGFGMMGMTWRSNPQPYTESFKTLKEALKLGSNFWNAGEIYGTPEKNSLQLLHAYFEQYPEDASKVVISIKGGYIPGTHQMDGSAANVRRSIDECLKVLDGTKKLDIFECARVDPKVPVEVTMRAAKEYIDSGKLGGICLSECGVDTIKRAAKVTKISGVEIEYSLWATEAKTNGVFETCKELGIPIIAYSPLGRGILSGQIKSLDDIPEDDFRRTLPRFSPENFPKNLELVAEVEKMAKRKGCTAGQIALAWVKSQSEKDGNPVIIPIPGTVTVNRVQENLVHVDLSDSDLQEVDSILESFPPSGGRYGGPLAAVEFGNSPPEK